MEWAQWVGGAVGIATVVAMMTKLGRDIGRAEARLDAVEELRQRVDRLTDATSSLQLGQVRTEERVIGLGEQLGAAQRNNNAGG